ncbi:MAG: hypothetical protein OYK82_14815 [Gammaproteobacteria bacterium]|nr:hypothetical protein [Gammaproteobacteria bacterium]
MRRKMVAGPARGAVVEVGAVAAGGVDRAEQPEPIALSTPRGYPVRSGIVADARS